MSIDIVKQALEDAKKIKELKTREAEKSIRQKFGKIINEEVERLLEEGLASIAGGGGEKSFDPSEEGEQEAPNVSPDSGSNEKGKQKTSKKTRKRIEKNIPSSVVDSKKDKEKVDISAIQELEEEDEGSEEALKESLSFAFDSLVYGIDGDLGQQIIKEGRSRNKFKSIKSILKEKYSVKRRNNKYCVMKKSSNGKLTTKKCYDNKKDADDYCTALRINASGDVIKENKNKKFLISLGELQKLVTVISEKIIFDYDFVPSGHGTPATRAELEEQRKLEELLNDFENEKNKVTKENKTLKEYKKKLERQIKILKEKNDRLSLKVSSLNSAKTFLQTKLDKFQKVLEEKIDTKKKNQYIQLIKESKNLEELKNIEKVFSTLMESQNKEIGNGRTRKISTKKRLGFINSILAGKNNDGDEEKGHSPSMIKESRISIEEGEIAQRFKELAGINDKGE